MSFAMDDLSLTNSVDVSKKTRIVNDSQSIAKQSDSVNQESEVNDAYEKAPQNIKTNQNDFTYIQEKSTKIDIINSSLKKIGTYVEEIKSSIEDKNSSEKASREKIDENYQKIQQVAEKTKFNGEKLMESDSLEELKIPEIKELKIDTEKQRQESSQKIDDLSKNIKNVEKELSGIKNSLIKEVNSFVELKAAPSEKIIIETKEIKKFSGEELKEAVIAGVKENPEQSKKVHIKHIDGNMLLAMLSLRVSV